jgi:flagellar protein FlaG
MTIQSIGSSTARASDRVAEPVALQPAARAPAAAADTSVAVERAAKTPSPEQLKEAVSNINKSLQSLGQDLEFSVDEGSNRTIVRVVDQKTKEVIRQIPSPEALEIAKALDTVSGLLIKQTA